MIGINTGSICDIPLGLVAQYGIIAIPQVVIWDERVLRDRTDLKLEGFYQRLVTNPTRPHSSLVIGIGSKMVRVDDEGWEQ